MVAISASWPCGALLRAGRGEDAGRGGQVEPEVRRDAGVVVDRGPRTAKITSGSVGLIHDREVEAVHALAVELLPARQSGLQRPANLPLAHGSIDVFAVHERGVRGEHDDRPVPGPQGELDRVGGGAHPSSFRTGSFSREHTATIGARWPTARHAWAVWESRSRVGTVTRIRPSAKLSSAHAAAVIVLPDPVADTIVPLAPRGGTDDLVGNPTHFRNADFWSTWCSRSRIILAPPCCSAPWLHR